MVGSARDILEDSMNDEEISLENLPENLSYSEKAEQMEDAIDILDEAISHLDDSIGSLDKVL